MESLCWKCRPLTRVPRGPVSVQRTLELSVKASRYSRVMSSDNEKV